MDAIPSDNPLTLFTVGHSNQELASFLDLLRTHEIEVLVDVRSRPYSRYVPHFNADPLSAALKRAGLSYLFLGKELGGRPEGEEYYDESGRALYYRVAESPLFLEGLTRLEQGVRRYRVAMMCSEEDPAVCHRALLVGRVMAERGVTILHIRGDGRLQPHAEIKAARRPPRGLFDSIEDRTWKSLRSVLRKNRPQNSSGSSDDTESDDWSMSD